MLNFNQPTDSLLLSVFIGPLTDIGVINPLFCLFCLN